VELIVVLVILAILAALLVPALTGYIDKAKEQSLVSEASMVLTAAQATVSEAYGSGAIDNTAALTASAKKGDMVDQIKELSETAQKADAHWAITLKVADASATYKTIKIATLECIPMERTPLNTPRALVGAPRSKGRPMSLPEL